MNKLIVCCAALWMACFAMGQTPDSIAQMDTMQVASTEHATQMDLTYDLVICNKTNSNYRLTIAGYYLGKVAPKKKQTFKARADWKGELVALQLDKYSIVPSKIIWKVPQQTPGSVVTFHIVNK